MPSLGAKGVPEGAHRDIFDPFGGYKWKCVSNAFVPAGASILRVGGGAERSLAQHFVTMFFDVLLGTTFLRCYRIGAHLEAHWDPWGSLFRHFLHTLFREQFGGAFGRGRRQGRGLSRFGAPRRGSRA